MSCSRNTSLGDAWGKGPSGPQGPFPHTPNPLPLFSVFPFQESLNHQES